MNMPMRQHLKVGYVLKRFPRLSETFILNELLELERQGVELTVFSLLRPPEEARHDLLDELKAQVIYLPSGSSANGLTVRAGQGGGKGSKLALSELIAEPALDDAVAGKLPQDLVTLGCKALSVAMLSRSLGLTHLHAHFASDATSVAMLAARIAGIDYSFTAHARDIYHTYSTPERDDAARALKIARSAFMVTVSDYNARHLKAVAGSAAANKVHRLYNGIDLSRFPAKFDGREEDTILAVGRLVEKKGFSDLVAACRKLADDGQPFACRIIGEGPLHDELAGQIERLGLTGRVALEGAMPQERLRAIMATATVFALPCIVTESGDRDGLPTVLLEAQARGLPCVSTRVAGVPEIIEHGETGLLCEPHEPAELATALAALLGDGQLRERIAHTARRAAEDKFNLSTNAGWLRSRFAEAAAQNSHDRVHAIADLEGTYA